MKTDAHAEPVHIQQKFEAIFRGSTVPFAFLEGPELRFEIFNPAFGDLFPGRDLAGRPLLEALPELHETAFPRAMRSVLETGRSRVTPEERALIRDPLTNQIEDRFFESELVRSAFGVLWHLTEVTPNVKAKHELQRARRAAASAGVAKRAFLSNMSHELRTPLGVILGFTDILRSSPITPEEREKYFDIVERSGQSLMRIIDDVLDLSSLEADGAGIETKAFDLRGLVGEAVAMFADQAAGQGIELTLEASQLPPFKIKSDEVRIRQVLVNLIGNALKFTPKGRVKIEGSFVSLEDDRLNVVLTVSDTGIGLTAEEAARVFKPFTQADDAGTRAYGGTGVGLALSRKLAQSLGGDVVLQESAKGRGSVFRFDLLTRKDPDPVIAAENAASAVGAARSLRLRGKKILVVDDSPDNRFLMRMFLRRQGAVIDEAANGEDAVRMARGGAHDVVLMDIQMPGLNGYEALKRLRLGSYGKPVIALTAYAMNEERERTRAAGFSAHVSKPVDAAELVDAILAQI